MSKRNNVLAVFVLMTSILFITGGVSLAAYSYLGIGNKEITISTSGVAFRYTEGKNKIELTEVMPLTNDQGKSQNNYFEFEVSGFTDPSYEVPYDITVRKSKDSSDIDDAIKLFLTKVDKNGNEEEVKLTTYKNIKQYVNSDINLSNHSEKLLYSDKVQKGTSYLQKYRLRVWISYDADYTQEKYNNAKFDLTVNVYGKGQTETTNVNVNNTEVEAGLYDANDNLIVSWDSLVNDYGLDIEKDYLETNSPFVDLMNTNPDLANGTKLIIGDVNMIGAKAFCGSSNLTKVEIPSSVETIGQNAFDNCTNLTSVTFKEDSALVTIDKEAFLGCTNVTTIDIPASVLTIGEEAFSDVPHISYNGTATGSPWGALAIN